MSRHVVGNVVPAEMSPSAVSLSCAIIIIILENYCLFFVLAQLRLGQGKVSTEQKFAKVMVVCLVYWQKV